MTRLPNPHRAMVDDRKIIGYLLNEAHPDGRAKARFFLLHGFANSAWQVLADALRRHAAEESVVQTVETPFGVRYVIEGILHAPDGRTPSIRTIWFVAKGEGVPTLVPAYPLKRRSLP